MTQQYGDNLEQVSPAGGHFFFWQFRDEPARDIGGSDGSMREGHWAFVTGDQWYELQTQGVITGLTITTPPVWIPRGNSLTGAANLTGPVAVSNNLGQSFYGRSGANPGSDITGDGTVANPYETPLGAYLAHWRRWIFFGEPLTDQIKIECIDITAETYDAPPISTIPTGPGGCSVTWSGSRQVPVAVSTTGTSSLEPNRAVVNNTTLDVATTCALDADGVPDLWADEDGSAFGLEFEFELYGSVCLPFSGTTARVLPLFNTFFATNTFHRYLTTWNMPTGPNSFIRQGQFGAVQGCGSVRFHGMKLAIQTGGAGATFFNTALSACVVTDNPTLHSDQNVSTVVNAYLNGGAGLSGSRSFVVNSTALSGFGFQVEQSGQNTLIDGVVTQGNFDAFAVAAVRGGSRLDVVKVDAEGSGSAGGGARGLFTVFESAELTFQGSANITIAGPFRDFVYAEGRSSVNVNAGASFQYDGAGAISEYVFRGTRDNVFENALGAVALEAGAGSGFVRDEPSGATVASGALPYISPTTFLRAN